MDFSLSINEYWQIITSYANPGKIIFYALSSSLIAFFSILFLLLFIKKIVLVKRRNLFLKYLSFAYMVFIPLLAGFFGFKWGLINSLRSDLISHIPKYTSSAERAFKDKWNFEEILLKKFPKTNMPNMKYSSNEVIDGISEEMYIQYENSLKNTSTNISDKAVSFFYKMARGKIIAYKVKQLIHKLLMDKIGTSDEVSKEIMDIKLEELLKEGLFTKIITVQVDSFFKGILKGVVITFLLILLLPIIEIIIAFIMYKRLLNKEKQDQLVVGI